MGFSHNLILATDSYKVSHWKQYPPGTTQVYSYFESRGGLFPETLFFGLQYFLDKYLAPGITQENIFEAQSLLPAHMGIFNAEAWQNLLKKHQGKLPIRIRAVPEGTRVNVSNVLFTVENTDPEFFWLTNYLETLLCQVWYPTTVATLSWHMKQIILKYLTETGDPSLIDFKLHDFGFRGVSSVESAGLGGCAHLVNFKGTDTLEALRVARDYYQSPLAGFSIPAAEHSTITSWGRTNETQAFENMINQYGDGTLYAVVSDSYDIRQACEKIWGTLLHDKVLSKKATLVVRPDSGIPHQIVPECLEILGAKFGFSMNLQGFKVLNPKIRLIQGDGVDLEETEKILSEMKRLGWSADNVAFGMGGALLQKLNRDTQRFAFKCSNVEVNGESRSVSKSPVTDPSKNSKAGKLALIKTTSNTFKTVAGPHDEDQLTTIFDKGELLQRYSLDEIRSKASN